MKYFNGLIGLLYILILYYKLKYKKFIKQATGMHLVDT